MLCNGFNGKSALAGFPCYIVYYSGGKPIPGFAVSRNSATGRPKETRSDFLNIDRISFSNNTECAGSNQNPRPQQNAFLQGGECQQVFDRHYTQQLSVKAFPEEDRDFIYGKVDDMMGLYIIEGVVPTNRKDIPSGTYNSPQIKFQNSFGGESVIYAAGMSIEGVPIEACDIILTEWQRYTETKKEGDERSCIKLLGSQTKYLKGNVGMSFSFDEKFVQVYLQTGAS